MARGLTRDRTIPDWLRLDQRAAAYETVGAHVEQLLNKQLHTAAHPTTWLSAVTVGYLETIRVPVAPATARGADDPPADRQRHLRNRYLCWPCWASLRPRGPEPAIQIVTTTRGVRQLWLVVEYMRRCTIDCEGSLSASACSAVGRLVHQVMCV